MSEEEFPPVIYALGGLRAATELHARALGAVVDDLGVIEGALVPRVSRAGARRDFVLFCTTKSCTTISAINVLFDALFAEETYPLTRTLYEHYLAMACVAMNDSNLDNFLAKPLGLYAGTLMHPLSKAGRPIRREIVHTATGRRYSGIVSIREMACATGYKYDPELHDVLYTFLSEHTHPNMLASGNYRDATGARYSYSEKRGLLQAAFWACIASALSVSEVAKFVGGSRRLRGEIREANDASKEALCDAADVLEFTGPFIRVPELVCSRLKARRRR